jgi:hypothetical protein
LADRIQVLFDEAQELAGRPNVPETPELKAPDGATPDAETPDEA